MACGDFPCVYCGRYGCIGGLRCPYRPLGYRMDTGEPLWFDKENKWWTQKPPTLIESQMSVPIEGPITMTFTFQNVKDLQLFESLYKRILENNDLR